MYDLFPCVKAYTWMGQVKFLFSISLRSPPMLSQLVRATIIFSSYAACTNKSNNSDQPISGTTVRSRISALCTTNHGTVRLLSTRNTQIWPIISTIDARNTEGNVYSPRIRTLLPHNEHSQYLNTLRDSELYKKLYMIPTRIKTEKPLLHEILLDGRVLNADKMKVLIERIESALKNPFRESYKEALTDQNREAIGSLAERHDELKILIGTVKRFFRNRRKCTDLPELVSSVEYFNKAFLQRAESIRVRHPFTGSLFFRYVFLVMASPKFSTKTLEMFLHLGISQDSHQKVSTDLRTANEYFKSQNTTRDFETILKNAMAILRDSQYLELHKQRFIAVNGTDTIESVERFELEYKILTCGTTSAWIIKSFESLVNGLVVCGFNFKTRLENIRFIFAGLIFDFMSEIVRDKKISNLDKKIEGLKEVREELIGLHNEITASGNLEDSSSVTRLYMFYIRFDMLTKLCTLFWSILLPTMGSTEILDIKNNGICEFMESLVCIHVCSKRLEVLMDVLRSENGSKAVETLIKS